MKTYAYIYIILHGWGFKTGFVQPEGQRVGRIPSAAYVRVLLQKTVNKHKNKVPAKL